MGDLSIQRLNELAELLVDQENDDWASEDCWASLLEAACEFDAARIQEVCAFVRQCKNANVDLKLEIAMENSPEGLAIGTRIDRFTLVREIDSGGMGTVYEAVFRAGDMEPRSVALKLIKSGRAEEELARRLRAETNLLSRLDHPNIIKIHDAGRTESGYPYFTMELVDGGLPLNRYCAGLPLVDRIEVFRKLCAVVQVVHENNIVHRDIKPRNVLITKAGEPKLLDFGLAAPIAPIKDAPSFVNTEPGPNGTDGRMSPQQRDGYRPAIADDIYSLGTILRDLIEGHRVAIGGSFFEDIKAIVSRCLATEPADRFQTAAELTVALGEAMSELEASTKPVNLSLGGVPFYRSRRVLGLGAVAVLVAGAFLAHYQSAKSKASDLALTYIEEDLAWDKKQEDSIVTLLELGWAKLLEPLTGIDAPLPEQERRARVLIEKGDRKAKANLGFVYIHCRGTILLFEKDERQWEASPATMSARLAQIYSRIPKKIFDGKLIHEEATETTKGIVRVALETVKNDCSETKVTEGLNWWREVASHQPNGNLAAQLAELLFFGSEAVPKNHSEAYKWAELSANLGNPDGT